MQKKDPIDIVGRLIEALDAKGLQPVLVGGMALVIMGSQRVTKDFDFLISFHEETIGSIVDVFYQFGFELISKFTQEREVLRTLDNPRIAAARLKIDLPDSCYFFNRDNRLKIDLLFDFPLPAKEVSSRSHKIFVKSHDFRLACREDLIRLKEIAYADRRSANDAQDLEFLRGLANK